MKAHFLNKCNLFGDPHGKLLYTTNLDYARRSYSLDSDTATMTYHISHIPWTSPAAERSTVSLPDLTITSYCDIGLEHSTERLIHERFNKLRLKYDCEMNVLTNGVNSTYVR